jgi:hypothetical protein
MALAKDSTRRTHRKAAISKAALIAANSACAAARARNAVAGPFVTLNGPELAGKKKTRRIPSIANSVNAPTRENILIAYSHIILTLNWNQSFGNFT